MKHVIVALIIDIPHVVNYSLVQKLHTEKHIS